LRCNTPIRIAKRYPLYMPRIDSNYIFCYFLQVWLCSSMKWRFWIAFNLGFDSNSSTISHELYRWDVLFPKKLMRLVLAPRFFRTNLWSKFPTKYNRIVLEFEGIFMEGAFDWVEYVNLGEKLPEMHPAIGWISPP